MTTLAIAPMMLFASGMAVLRASETQHLPGVAAWLTVSALPLIIGVAGILVVSLSWEALVMDWLTYLERLSRAYARGRYSLRPRAASQPAPAEFGPSARQSRRWLRRSNIADQALRDALDEQTVLLREVHHRVKNNLQIVGSLLSLQAQRSADPAAREALLDALVRVDAIALGQRFMREQEEEEQVPSVELFDETFVRQSLARLGVSRRSLEIVADVEPGLLPQETGWRLVLLAAEALLDACHAVPGPLIFRLELRFDEDCAILGWSPAPDEASHGRVTYDLINGYVRQLRAQLEPAPELGGIQARAPLPQRTQKTRRQRRGNRLHRGRRDPKFFRILPKDRTERGVAS